MESIKNLLSSFKDEELVKLEFDENMESSDCKILWEDGSITKNDAEIWQQVTQIVENYKLTG
jgi:flagellar biosynthesis/type III secretory pathway protein FliH